MVFLFSEFCDVIHIHNYTKIYLVPFLVYGAIRCEISFDLLKMNRHFSSFFFLRFSIQSYPYAEHTSHQHTAFSIWHIECANRLVNYGWNIIYKCTVHFDDGPLKAKAEKCVCFVVKHPTSKKKKRIIIMEFLYRIANNKMKKVLTEKMWQSIPFRIAFEMVSTWNDGKNVSEKENRQRAFAWQQIRSTYVYGVFLESWYSTANISEVMLDLTSFSLRVHYFICDTHIERNVPALSL